MDFEQLGSARSSIVERMKQRQRKRRAVITKGFGLTNPNQLATVLGYGDEIKALQQYRESKWLKLPEHLRKDENDAKSNSDPSASSAKERNESNSNPSKDKRGDADLDTVEAYKGSKTFLKGTQSANPHNDYSQHFVDTGQRPQNFIRDAGINERFEEYPKLKELIRLKDELIQKTATPPMYLKADLQEFDLADLGCKFDVIIIEPPLEEYQRLGAAARNCWTWGMIQQLNIAAVADYRCFVYVWCGSTPEGLNSARDCLKHWGFRRCEDICWVRQNREQPGQRGHLDADSLFQRTKEHCLMGIRGTVRRSHDGDFIHANVDIDLLISEGEPYGSTQKPLESFLVAEHFCLGRRRLHIFGRDSTIRPGWLTIGPELTSSNFDPQIYRSFFRKRARTHHRVQRKNRSFASEKSAAKGAAGASREPAAAFAGAGQG